MLMYFKILSRKYNNINEIFRLTTNSYIIRILYEWNLKYSENAKHDNIGFVRHGLRNKNIKFDEIRRNLTSIRRNSGRKFESCQFKFEFTPDSRQIGSNCTQLH